LSIDVRRLHTEHVRVGGVRGVGGAAAAGVGLGLGSGWSRRLRAGSLRLGSGGGLCGGVAGAGGGVAKLKGGGEAVAAVLEGGVRKGPKAALARRSATLALCLARDRTTSAQ
jgi:hypothetical protein